MIGLIYPGVNRLELPVRPRGRGVPKHIESNNDPQIARWLEKVIHLIPVAPRPDGYNPLGGEEPRCGLESRSSVRRARGCYEAIVGRDAKALGRSMNQCMQCWESGSCRTRCATRL